MYRDLRQHIRALDAADLLHRVAMPINKDTEMHALVRWQYRGGIPESRRRAFLFTNVTDSRGRRYGNSVLVGGLAGTPAIYAMGLGCAVEEIGDRWKAAMERPVPPERVASGPVQEVVHEGEDLDRMGGLMSLPVPISTPGYDNAPYLTSAHHITVDPETGIRNMGNYRGQIKGPRTCGLYFSPHGNDAAVHWEKARRRGEHLPVAIVVGAPPVVSYAAVQRVHFGIDELAVAGGLAGQSIPVVRCRTVDLEVPADAEVCIEGRIRTDFLEEEGPFGESHGFVHPRAHSPLVEVTCITHRTGYIWTSFISQVTPSESSVIKKVGYEPMFLRFLRDEVGIRSVVGVVMHEPLSNIRPVLFIRFRQPDQGDVWRALKLASSYHKGVGKMVIAVDEDIDPHDADAVFWALAYRMTPHQDVQIVRGFDKGHAPPFRDVPPMENSVMLINATLREKMPPISLPKREFMERGRELWQELGLPEIVPQSPWHGYSLGEWWDELDQEAALAVQGRWDETGAKLAGRRYPTGETGDGGGDGVAGQGTGAGDEGSGARPGSAPEHG
jgi:UbiD family decarboxylase